MYKMYHKLGPIKNQRDSGSCVLLASRVTVHERSEQPQSTGYPLQGEFSGQPPLGAPLVADYAAIVGAVSQRSMPPKGDMATLDKVEMRAVLPQIRKSGRNGVGWAAGTQRQGQNLGQRCANRPR